MDPINNQNNPLTQGLVNPQQKQDLAVASGAGTLPIDQQQQKMNELTATVLRRVFSRIVHVLMDEDISLIKKLDEGGEGNTEAIKYFLITKIPNLEKIVQEEVDLYKKELQESPRSL